MKFPILHAWMVTLQGVSITKHVIGYREGQEVAIMVHQENDMEIIRKFHSAPLFFRWGRDLDQSYHIEDNKKWLKRSQNKPK